MVKENLAMVEDRVKAACDRAGRSYGSVTLIAVSKTKPIFAIGIKLLNMPELTKAFVTIWHQAVWGKQSTGNERKI